MIIKYIIFFTKDKLFSRLIHVYICNNSREKQFGPPFLAARRASGGVPCFVFAFTRSPAYAR